MRRFSKNYAEEGIIVLFTALTSTFSVILSFVGYDVLINPTYAAEVLLYYVYTYSQYTKRDPLTKLFNRQTFNRYMKRKERMVSGIISIDMNELKWINDTMGHDEGDKAIKKIAECILQPTTTRETVYRVGGDEFIVICCHGDQNHIEQLKLIRKSALDQVGLSYYYGAWMHLYGELGSYTERPGMQQVYYDQQNAYRDSVLMVAPEGTEDWYHMKMDILNGRRYYQEALQFSNRWIRNAPPNSHARAFAAFYRSMVYSNLHNEEQTRYWLGRSAIEDIKCGVMDQASLLFLAERLANDGDIERAQRYLEFSKKCNDYFCHHMRSYQVNSVIAIIEKSREAAEKRASLWFTVSMVVTALLLLTLIIVIIRKIKK